MGGQPELIEFAGRNFWVKTLYMGASLKPKAHIPTFQCAIATAATHSGHAPSIQKPVGTAPP